MEKGGTYFIYVQKGDNVYKILSIYKKEKAKASDVMLKKGTYFKGEIIGFSLLVNSILFLYNLSFVYREKTKIAIEQSTNNSKNNKE